MSLNNALSSGLYLFGYEDTSSNKLLVSGTDLIGKDLSILKFLFSKITPTAPKCHIPKSKSCVWGNFNS